MTLQFGNNITESEREKRLIEYEELNVGSYEVNNQFVMVPLFIVLIVIMIWCFYLRFVMAFIKRKRLLWVEVQDHTNSEYSITRNVAKQNLHLVGEITQKLKSYNYLFDKYWYRQREFQYIDGISEE